MRAWGCMSKDVEKYRLRAREARERANNAAGEYRELMESIAEAYELLLLVQLVIDDPDGVYELPPTVH